MCSHMDSIFSRGNKSWKWDLKSKWQSFQVRPILPNYFSTCSAPTYIIILFLRRVSLRVALLFFCKFKLYWKRRYFKRCRLEANIDAVSRLDWKQKLMPISNDGLWIQGQAFVQPLINRLAKANVKKLTSWWHHIWDYSMKVDYVVS